MTLKLLIHFKENLSVKKLNRPNCLNIVIVVTNYEYTLFSTTQISRFKGIICFSESHIVSYHLTKNNWYYKNSSTLHEAPLMEKGWRLDLSLIGDS